MSQIDNEGGVIDRPGRVLIVAGSDSGGGAGIEGDIKTVTALGGYAASAITGLTAQNSTGIKETYPVPPDFVTLQMSTVLDDIGADAIKTGMLRDAGVVEAVCRVLDEKGKEIPVIVDPVMAAKNGHRLLASKGIEIMKDSLFPRAFLLTPNMDEAVVLTGRDVETLDDMRRAGEQILKLGPQAVLVKGGHMKGSILKDLLVWGDGEKIFESNRVVSDHTHGTGCALATAIATGVAQGMELVAAIERARRYLHLAIENAPGLGEGAGPLGHGHNILPFA